MSTFALALILGSAVIHASWNLMAKQAKDGNTFIWLTSFLILPIYAPFAIYIFLVDKPTFTRQKQLHYLARRFYTWFISFAYKPPTK